MTRARQPVAFVALATGWQGFEKGLIIAGVSAMLSHKRTGKRLKPRQNMKNLLPKHMKKNTPSMRSVGLKTTTKTMSVLLCSALLSAFTAGATVVNVKTDFGAAGNGFTDDTKAFQDAIAAAVTKTGNTGGVLYIPAGNYLITSTLNIARVVGLIMEGEGSSSYGVNPAIVNLTQSRLIWGGAAGGTLVSAQGILSCVFKNLVFQGYVDGGDVGNRAGILFHVTSLAGWGSMLNKFSNISFTKAVVGLQNGANVGDSCCADDSFDNVYFGNLDVGFCVKNNQGVDYLFNFAFAFNVKKVISMERGGNLMVNNLQCTNTDLVVEILGGGSNCATYLFNNVRLEDSTGGATYRRQLLKCNPTDSAIVKFTGFQDAQWAWSQNPAFVDIPLCEVGPRTTLVFDASMFNSFVATVTGSPAYWASVALKSCTLKYVNADNCVAANAYGFYKVTECRNGAKFYRDRSTWPADADMQ